MRLIDADALWAEFMELADTGIEFDGEGVANAIANAPTVDAVPVVRGRWRMETDEEEPNPMFKLPVCCVCGKTGGMTNYCPNCGASMRERSEGE